MWPRTSLFVDKHCYSSYGVILVKERFFTNTAACLELCFFCQSCNPFFNVTEINYHVSRCAIMTVSEQTIIIGYANINKDFRLFYIKNQNNPAILFKLISAFLKLSGRLEITLSSMPIQNKKWRLKLWHLQATKFWGTVNPSAHLYKFWRFKAFLQNWLNRNGPLWN